MQSFASSLYIWASIAGLEWKMWLKSATCFVVYLPPHDQSCHWESGLLFEKIVKIVTDTFTHYTEHRLLHIN
jgi:hypothetical protein